MNFMRRWTRSGEVSFSNNSSCVEKERPQLEIISDGVSNHRVRKRDLLGPASNSDRIGSSHPKRRRTAPTSFSFSNLLFNPVKTMYSLISGEDDERNDHANGPAYGMQEVEMLTSASSSTSCGSPTTSLSKLREVGSFDDPNNHNDLEVTVVSDTSNVVFPPMTMGLEVQRGPEVGGLLSGNEVEDAEDVIYIGMQPSSSSFEKQDEDDEATVQFVKEVERQEDADDVEIVAEICNSPRGSLLANRRSVESAKEQVTFLSSSIDSPARSESSMSVMEGHAHDQVSTSSPAPEDSISRQGTPYGLRFSTLPHNGDPWKRRKPGIQKSKFSEPSHVASLERNFTRIRAENGTRSGVPASNVNLLARDYLLDIVVKMGGSNEAYPSRTAHNFPYIETDKRKSFRKAKRVVDGYDGVRRVRSALEKCLQTNSVKSAADEKYGTKDLNKSFERQSSSEQLSEDGDITSSLFESSSGEGARISSGSEIPSSASMTPRSTVSSGVDRITELLEKMNNFGRRPTPDQKYNRFVAERQELRNREIALQEEIRIRSLARLSSREHIEEQARRRLKLIGIHVPVIKPKIKDEFPPLSDEAQKLCQYVWNKRLPESENFSEAFGIKLTRKDLSTLSGLDWLNDEVINFYLQLVCQRSVDAKDLPKVYAFNTFFYANISTKGYTSVRRWTRRVDIFAYDMLLVPVHLSVHWCVAVVDLAEKRIDYYDSLLGRNQNCIENLKNYLSEECKDKKNQVFDFNGWEFNLRTDIPRQMNGSDCGVFACKFAEFASRRAPIVFTQQHMPYYRKRMVYELVEQKLL